MVKSFKSQILEGIGKSLPKHLAFDTKIERAPKRNSNLSFEEKKLSLVNALRYFPKKWHSVLMPEFQRELDELGHIYMYRFRPSHEMYARPYKDYPYQCLKAACIMHMIQNNLDPRIAQYPYELITYGGNGAVFQNWAQYRLTMQLLAKMKDDQTLSVYSGHPMALFPSSTNAPRAIVTNGMMVPNYSSKEQFERFNAMGVTQYGQMTAGSYMYIGPQGIVHGTAITLLNALRLRKKNKGTALFVSSGLGGMSGAQAKASKIAGVLGIIAEINPSVIKKRKEQGWVDEVFLDLNILGQAIKSQKGGRSLVYEGNVVDLWQYLLDHDVKVDLGSDQTSLHNPFSGGYHPVGLSLDESRQMMLDRPELFKERVKQSLVKQCEYIGQLTQKGMYFFDYGNAFLLEAHRANADVMKNGVFKYPSYVEDIMGPMCFDLGFGPFRWICTSGLDDDLDKTDQIAARVLALQLKKAKSQNKQQIQDNLDWILNAKNNQLVVGSKARILYADEFSRVQIALAFNHAISKKIIKGPIVLGRDHHDVSGTDSPYRETANIKDGSKFTADMSVQNALGLAARGATWVSLHNGGGVGFGEAINGGFGLVLDGQTQTNEVIKKMLAFDVQNGLARRAWAGNPNAIWAIEQSEKLNKKLSVTKRMG